MLDDLRTLLGQLPVDASRADYARAIVSDNILGKPTKKARELALRYLVTLYALDLSNPIFRAMRKLWTSDQEAQPLLALAMALSRDPLLKATQAFFLGLQQGTVVSRYQVEEQLSLLFPDRFSPASVKSFAQNIAGSWTAAGLLRGHSRKVRVALDAYPSAVAFLLFLGYLEGRSGQRLFSSEWVNLLGGSPDELVATANSASHRGLIVLMNAGGVKEVRFPGYLTPEEEQVRLEVSHVV